MSKSSGGVRSKTRGRGVVVDDNKPTDSIFKGIEALTGEYKNATFNYNTTILSLNDVKKYVTIAGIPNDYNGIIRVNFIDNERIEVIINDFDIMMTRRINIINKTVYNAYFRITEGRKYDGRGYKIFAGQVDAGIKNGYTRFDVSAAGSPTDTNFNGYYTWAAFGYSPSRKAQFLETINNRIADNNIKFTSWEEAIRTNSGRAIWKANGNSWSGSFDLSNNSENMTTLRQYIDYRQKQN